MKKMKSIRVFAVLLAAVAVPASFGASADKKPSAEGDAQIIDTAEYPCSNCLFGTSDHFYCMRLDNKIVIAHQHVPTMNYIDPQKNYLTKYHKTWTPWKPGATVHVKYNDKYIWVQGWAGKPDAKKKDVRMEQKYTTDIFINNGPCRDAIKVPEEKARKL
jgi:hypothetical protein